MVTSCKPSGEQMVITWVQKFHCHFVLKLDILTWVCMCFFLEQKALPLRVRMNSFLYFFFQRKHSVYFVVLFTGGYNHAIRQ